MQSLADGLPEPIAKRVHPDWRKNEVDYWAQRDTLLSRYRNEWVAFANGAVVASGTSPVDVFHAAQASGLHPFVICVGRESEPSRMRRVVFPYDDGYPGEPLPLVTVEFRTQENSPGMVLDRVIPDTGADGSALPWADCQTLQLDMSQGLPALMTGIGQSTAPTVVFSVWARLNDDNYRCRLQADFTGHERLLGRDVLNRLDVLFRGPTSEVIIEP